MNVLLNSLPHLSWHHLGVSSTNINTRKKTSSVVRLHDLSRVDFIRSDSTVVRSLGTGESILRPPKGSKIHVQKGVLLLYAKPRNVTRGTFHCVNAKVSLVGFWKREKHPVYNKYVKELQLFSSNLFLTPIWIIRGKADNSNQRGNHQPIFVEKYLLSWKQQSNSSKKLGIW